MDTLQDAYKDSEEDAEENQNQNPNINPNQDQDEQNQNPSINSNENQQSVPQNPTHLPSPEQISQPPISEPKPETAPTTTESPDNQPTTAGNVAGESTEKAEPLGSEDASTDSVSEDEQNPETLKFDNEEEQSSPKKQKTLSPQQQVKTPASNGSKKSSKKKTKGNNVWTKSTSRKGKKKSKSNTHNTPKSEDTVFITPILRFPDKNDDTPDAKICLSKIYKAEKVELSDDRLSAGSCKGYRMVRATRGVTEGAWYFEIRVLHLGESGHTRLGWSTEKGDLQAPVGYDANSFGYRDIDGSKIHKALREKYGEEGYKEGDVIGFYINLPDGNSYAPKPPHLVWYKGQKYVCAPDPKEDPPKIIPGSEMSFFKNGICQGVAFSDLFGGRYYPAASMYTLPNQPNCVVKFNFGPDFEKFPVEFGDRPIPRPMIEVPYHGFDNRVENGVE